MSLCLHVHTRGNTTGNKWHVTTKTVRTNYIYKQSHLRGPIESVLKTKNIIGPRALIFGSDEKCEKWFFILGLFSRMHLFFF